ncbi:helix-turn-helix domain-containing protein [Nonomuraea sp. KM90]|uniref:helix-turn-helix domain-containing protein n=1 Tax=Nonomuraea sp. KM90 TaxID=3457428 RepID=UPI003FCCBC26
MQERRLDHDPVRLRRRRVAAGLEAQELARRVGISKSALSRIERGHNNASPPVLERLAQALNCQIADLMPEEVGRREENPTHSQPAA